MSIENWFENHLWIIDRISREPELARYIEDQALDFIWKNFDDENLKQDFIKDIFIKNWWWEYEWNPAQISRLFSFLYINKLEKLPKEKELVLVNTNGSNLMLRTINWWIIDRVPNWTTIELISNDEYIVNWYNFRKVSFNWKDWYVSANFIEPISNNLVHTLDQYILNLWIQPSFDFKRHLYKTIDPTWHYRWSEVQDNEIFHRIIQDLDLNKLIESVDFQIQEDLEDLRLDILWIEVDDEWTEVDYEEFPLDTSIPLESGNLLETPEIDTSVVPKNSATTIWDIQELDETLEVKSENDEITVDYILNNILSNPDYSNWVIRNSRAPRWTVLDNNNIKELLNTVSLRLFWEWINNDDINSNLKIFAQIHISSSWLQLWEYMRDLWLNNRDRALMRDLFSKYSNWRSSYRWTIEDNLLIYRWLVIENQLGSDFTKSVRDVQSSNIDYVSFWLDPNRLRSFNAEYRNSWWRRISYCSRTARLNLEKMWINRDQIIRWDAIRLISSLKRNWNWYSTDFNWALSRMQDLANSWKWNVFDIYPETRNWHRAVAFLWNDWQIYVKDPYYHWVEPIPFQNYRLSNNRFVVWPHYMLSSI